MTTPEGRLKAKIKAFLKERGAYFFMPVPSGYETPTLDFIGCYKGRFFAIETKAPGKQPTPRQYHTIREMNQAGANAVWDWDAERLRTVLKEWFDAVDRATNK